MRIVAGAYRGRALVAPKGHSTRPTADRTRQAIFNVLEHAPWGRPLTGVRVIDLFAGSGALGLEALSRGAAFCLFVDEDRSAREAIAANVVAFRAAEKAKLIAADATRLPPLGEDLFGLAFLDPPYGRDLAKPSLASLVTRLAPGALVAVERGDGESPLSAPGYRLLDERRWGAAHVTFLAKA